jgi:hypothetical protein
VSGAGSLPSVIMDVGCGSVSSDDCFWLPAGDQTRIGSPSLTGTPQAQDIGDDIVDLFGCELVVRHGRMGRQQECVQGQRRRRGHLGDRRQGGCLLAIGYRTLHRVARAACFPHDFSPFGDVADFALGERRCRAKEQENGCA